MFFLFIFSDCSCHISSSALKQGEGGEDQASSSTLWGWSGPVSAFKVSCEPYTTLAMKGEWEPCSVAPAMKRDWEAMLPEPEGPMLLKPEPTVCVAMKCLASSVDPPELFYHVWPLGCPPELLPCFTSSFLPWALSVSVLLVFVLFLVPLSWPPPLTWVQLGQDSFGLHIHTLFWHLSYWFHFLVIVWV